MAKCFLFCELGYRLPFNLETKTSVIETRNWNFFKEYVDGACNRRLNRLSTGSKIYDAFLNHAKLARGMPG
jgi:hypothetical protein